MPVGGGVQRLVELLGSSGQKLAHDAFASVRLPPTGHDLERGDEGFTDPVPCSLLADVCHLFFLPGEREGLGQSDDAVRMIPASA